MIPISLSCGGGARGVMLAHGLIVLNGILLGFLMVKNNVQRNFEKDEYIFNL